MLTATLFPVTLPALTRLRDALTQVGVETNPPVTSTSFGYGDIQPIARKGRRVIPSALRIRLASDGVVSVYDINEGGIDSRIHRVAYQVAPSGRKWHAEAAEAVKAVLVGQAPPVQAAPTQVVAKVVKGNRTRPVAPGQDVWVPLVIPPRRKIETAYEAHPSGRIRRVDGTEVYISPKHVGPGGMVGPLGMVVRGPKPNGDYPLREALTWTFVGPPPTEKHRVGSKNGSYRDMHEDNLTWVLSSRLGKSRASEMTPEQLDSFFELYQQGCTPKDIGKRMSVEQGVRLADSTVTRIIEGQLHQKGKWRAYYAKAEERRILSLKEREARGIPDGDDATRHLRARLKNGGTPGSGRTVVAQISAADPTPSPLRDHVQQVPHVVPPEEVERTATHRANGANRH